MEIGYFYLSFLFFCICVLCMCVCVRACIWEGVGSAPTVLNSASSTIPLGGVAGVGPAVTSNRHLPCLSQSPCALSCRELEGGNETKKSIRVIGSRRTIRPLSFVFSPYISRKKPSMLDILWSFYCRPSTARSFPLHWIHHNSCFSNPCDLYRLWKLVNC